MRAVVGEENGTSGAECEFGGEGRRGGVTGAGAVQIEEQQDASGGCVPEGAESFDERKGSVVAVEVNASVGRREEGA